MTPASASEKLPTAAAIVVKSCPPSPSTCTTLDTSKHAPLVLAHRQRGELARARRIGVVGRRARHADLVDAKRRLVVGARVVAVALRLRARARSGARRRLVAAVRRIHRR